MCLIIQYSYHISPKSSMTNSLLASSAQLSILTTSLMLSNTQLSPTGIETSVVTMNNQMDMGR